MPALGSGVNPFASELLGAHGSPEAPARASVRGIPAFHFTAEWGSALLRTAAVGESSSLPWRLPGFTEDKEQALKSGFRPGPSEEGEQPPGEKTKGRREIWGRRWDSGG